jgi:hypothetical protein
VTKSRGGHSRETFEGSTVREVFVVIGQGVFGFELTLCEDRVGLASGAYKSDGWLCVRLVLFGPAEPHGASVQGARIQNLRSEPFLQAVRDPVRTKLAHLQCTRACLCAIRLTSRSAVSFFRRDGRIVNHGCSRPQREDPRCEERFQPIPHVDMCACLSTLQNDVFSTRGSPVIVSALAERSRDLSCRDGGRTGAIYKQT